jgi:hypothetical protein
MAVVAVSAGDSGGLSERLRVLILQAHGATAWEVEMDGDVESVRYAVECAGIEARCTPAWHHGVHHVRASVDSNAAAVLQDAWTAPLSLRMQAMVEGRRLCIVRERGEHAVVEVETGASGELPAAMAALVGGAELPRPARPDASRLPLAMVLAMRRLSRIPPRFALAVSAAAVLLAAVVAVLLLTLHRAAPVSRSVQPSAEVTLPAISTSLLATDPNSNRLELVGCCESSGSVTVWRWDGDAWTRVAAASTGPPFRRGAAFTWDAHLQEFLYEGGEDASDTWTWDGLNWRHLHPAHNPQPGAAVAVYDAAAGVTVLAVEGASAPGGSSDGLHTQTWTWNGVDWTRIPGIVPFLYGPAAMAYDPVRGVVVLLDEAGGFGDEGSPTWTFDGSAWHGHEGTAGPPWDPSTQLAWDASEKRVVAVLLGDTAFPLRGVNEPAVTWSWDGTHWTQASDGAAPESPGRLVAWSGRLLFITDSQQQGAMPDFWLRLAGGWQDHESGAGLAHPAG